MTPESIDRHAGRTIHTDRPMLTPFEFVQCLHERRACPEWWV